MRLVLAAATLTLLGGVSPDASPAAEQPMQSARQALRFVTLLGRDTIAVEEALWTGDSLRGVILVQEPEIIRYDYSLRAAATGGFASVRVTESVIGPEGWRERRVATLTALGDSVLIQLAPDSVARRVLAPAPLLSLPGSGALLWFAAQRFDALGADSVSIPWIAPLGGPGGRFIARRAPERRIEYRLSGGFSQLRREADGTITGIDARATTLKIEVMPAQPGVLVETQERWSRLRGGSLSPRDTVRVRVGPVALMIDYGRPSVRGREVFADGVLGDSVWRTGANAATQLRTSQALQFASGTVPAGTYSLFTRITAERAELIVNTRIGIWGTQYSSETDLLRVPLQRARAGFVEQFSVAVDTVNAAIVLRWADQEFRAPFRISP